MIVSFVGRASVTAIGVILVVLEMTSPAIAQNMSSNPWTDQRTETGEQTEEAVTQDEGFRQTARNANTGIGEVGQRLTSQDAAPLREPLDRIESRINSRVENRLRNRIDRNYRPAQLTPKRSQTVGGQSPD